MSSSDQEQATDKVWDISDLPADLRRQTAAWVEHSGLPALCLVSRSWNKAANLAVRQLKHDYSLQPEQLRLIGQRWPNLERLDLNCYSQPYRYGRNVISSWRPLMRLQHLSLGIRAALLPEGQEFMLRQTRLLTLGIFDMFFGASDGLLQVIGRLSHLTRLECGLQAERRVAKAFLLPPLQLEPATDEGVQCLSSLHSLQDLALTINKCPSPNNNSIITGLALSTIGSLHQLTRLSLNGWPMVDTDLGHLTHLQLLSLDLWNCLSLTSGCLRHISRFTSLRSLCIAVGGGDWCTEDPELDAFKEVANEVMPILTTLNL